MGKELEFNIYRVIGVLGFWLSLIGVIALMLTQCNMGYSCEEIPTSVIIIFGLFFGMLGIGIEEK